jgi:glycosyltransferase involved in cell wall biosynthesis
VELLVRLQERVPSLRAVIAGEGSEQAALHARISALGASSWLQLVGRVPDDELIQLYRRAWVLASTSAFEGWGMTITEAAACGTPTVATRIPGHMDAVHDGTSGLLANSVAEMEDALAAVLLEEDLRRRLNKGAEERASSLTWDRTAWGTLRVLADDARRRRSSRG